jgi:hypothetical protein
MCSEEKTRISDEVMKHPIPNYPGYFLTDDCAIIGKKGGFLRVSKHGQVCTSGGRMLSLNGAIRSVFGPDHPKFIRTQYRAATLPLKPLLRPRQLNLWEQKSTKEWAPVEEHEVRESDSWWDALMKSGSKK